MLELMIWITMVAIFMGLIARRIVSNKPKVSPNALLIKLNGLAMLAGQEALASGRLTRLSLTRLAGDEWSAHTHVYAEANVAASGTIDPAKFQPLPGYPGVDNFWKTEASTILLGGAWVAGQEVAGQEIHILFTPQGFCQEAVFRLTFNDTGSVYLCSMHLHPLQANFKLEPGWPEWPKPAEAKKMEAAKPT